MSNTVRILRSATTGATPSALVSGQIAINEADGKLFYRNGSGAVTEFTGSGGATQVLEYSSPSAFPATGTAARIYISTSTGRLYRWDTSVYVEIGGAGADGGDYA